MKSEDPRCDTKRATEGPAVAGRGQGRVVFRQDRYLVEPTASTLGEPHAGERRDTSRLDAAAGWVD